MPNVLPVTPRAGGPIYHWNCVPGASLPFRDADFTSGFQLGQPSIEVNRSQTVSASASISISHSAAVRGDRRSRRETRQGRPSKSIPQAVSRRRCDALSVRADRRRFLVTSDDLEFHA